MGRPDLERPGLRPRRRQTAADQAQQWSMHNDALHLFPLADRFDRTFVSGAVGGVVAGLVVAGTSFAVFGVAAAVLVLPYLLTAAVSAVRRSAVAA